MTAAGATHHACAGGCGARVLAHHFACPQCWWRLPPALQDAMTATGGDPDAHVEAMLAAIAWYREESVVTPEPQSDVDDEREVERRVLDVVRDVFAVLDAHGYQRTSDDAALGRAVVAAWALVEEYEGQTADGTAPPPSITCPLCQMTSYSPGDIEHGYCGNCHQYTSAPTPESE